MMLEDGYTILPEGKIASVVTFLRMEQPAMPSGFRVEKPDWSLQLHSEPDLDWYRALFRRVGQDWLWFSRLRMTDDELRTIIHDPDVDVYSLRVEGTDAGLLELDRRSPPDIELAFIGLAGEWIGRGAGRFLLGEAIALAWAYAPRHVIVHTCTLDHPRALPLYRQAGFVPYGRAIEIAGDPRLDGTLPGTAAPQHPIL